MSSQQIFKVIDALIETTIKAPEMPGMLIKGPTSLGKTYRVIKKLQEFQKQPNVDYFIHGGRTTKLQLYCILQQNSDKIHIFDDTSLFEDKDSLNILKCCLGDGGVCDYNTSKPLPQGIQSSFAFTGTIFIVTNTLPITSHADFLAIRSRIYYYELNLTRDQIFELLTERVQESIGLGTIQERLEVIDWLKNNVKFFDILNYRLYEEVLLLRIRHPNDWKELAHQQPKNINLQEMENIFTNLLRDGMSKPEAYETLVIQGCSQKEFCNLTGLSRRSFYVYKHNVVQKEKEMEPLK